MDQRAEFDEELEEAWPEEDGLPQNAAEYQRVCHSKFGTAAFGALLKFAANVKNYVPNVLLTVVDSALTEAEIAECKQIAADAGVTLRVRRYIGKDA